MFNEIKECSICKKEYTTMHVEYKPGVKMYVCPACMEKTKDNFVWFCLGCGRTYFRPKESVRDRLANSGIENALALCDGMQLIMGIDMCIDCNPEGILEYVSSEIVKHEMQTA